MPFDATQPFTVEDAPKSAAKGFDPSKPFEVEATSGFDPSKPHEVQAEPEDFPWDVKPREDDNLPDGTRMTGAQLEARREHIRKQRLDPDKGEATPVYPLETALGIGIAGIETGALAAARAAGGAFLRQITPGGPRPSAPRTEPPAPGSPSPPEPTPPAPAASPTAPKPTVDLGGIEVGEAGKPPASVPEAGPVPGAPSSLKEAGIRPTPEPATGTETIDVPQPDGTVVQVQVRIGQAQPPPAEPPAPAPTAEAPAAGAPRPPTAGAPSPAQPGQAWDAIRQQWSDLRDKYAPGEKAPWEPVAEAPVSEPQAETPVSAEGIAGKTPPVSPETTAAPVNQPEEPKTERVPASALKPGDQIIVGDRTHEVEAVRPWTGDQVGVKLKGVPKLQIGPPDGVIRKLPIEPTDEEKAAAPVEGFGGPWTPVMKDGKPAKNYLGDQVYQNENGVRAILEDGVPSTEATKETDKGLEPKNAENRKRQHLTADEPWSTPAAETRPASPRPARPRPGLPTLASPSHATPRPGLGEENIPETSAAEKPEPESQDETGVEAGETAPKPAAKPKVESTPEPEPPR